MASPVPKLLASAKLGGTNGIIGAAVPGGKRWTISTIHITSLDTVTRTFKLHHVPSGGSADDTNALFFNSPLAAGDAAELGRGINCAAGDEFDGLCSAANKVLVLIYGIEYDA